jgi:hypothetical protein
VLRAAIGVNLLPTGTANLCEGKRRKEWASVFFFN